MEEAKGRRILSVIISIVIIAVWAFYVSNVIKQAGTPKSATRTSEKFSSGATLQDNQNKLNEAAAKIKQAADGIKNKNSTTESEELKNAG